MSEYRTRQKEKIINSAFHQWAGNQFQKTSLNLIALNLEITKSALYRYFPNKDDLLRSMEESFFSKLAGELQAFVANTREGSVAETVDQYFVRLYHFFGSCPHYYSFLIFHLLKQPGATSGPLSVQREAMQRVFLHSLERGGSAGALASPRLAVFFLEMTALFWMMQLFKRKNANRNASNFFNFVHKIVSHDILEASQKAADLCLFGFSTYKGAPPVDFQAIEERCTLQTCDLLKPDRIFSAIEEVIAETGFADASVEKIAERIGINKSSLYFYFKNRDDMLSKTVLREQEHFFKLAQERYSLYRTFPEQLYAFFVTIASYLKNNPELMTVLHWTRYQNIGLSLPRKGFHEFIGRFGFINEALGQGILRGESVEPSSLVAFIHFLIMSELRSASSKEGADGLYLRSLRVIFGFFINGIAQGPVAAPLSES